MPLKLSTHHARTARPAPTFTIPEADQGEFQRLPKEVRDDVDKLLIEFEHVYASHKVNPMIAKIAARLDFRRGFRYSTLRTKYYTYINGGRKGAVGHGRMRAFGPGDWRILVDYARCTYLQRFEEHEHGVFLPKEFVEYLKGLFQSNQRKSEPAIRLLYRLWRAGESIPGYGTWQEWFMDNHPHHPLPTGLDGRHECPPEMPRGWSRGNLARYLPERAELALARRGIAAARQHLPSVLMTREGLRPLEIVLFDDVRTDFKILVPGHAAPVELNLLVALDLATGMILRFGLRPAILRDDGPDGESAKDKLKLRDMKTLIAGILSTYGVPKNYTTTYVVENATAAIREGTALALAELSCQRIQVSRTMMINGTAVWGGYKDKPIGNPRGKAALESTFNLLHNEAAFLPGQTGRRYDAGPADLHGRAEEAKSLARVANKFLTSHQRASLKLPFLSRDQARLVLADIFNQIIRRTDHEMENFQVLGEWRQKDFDAWRPEHELSTLNLDLSIIQWRNPPRRESPLERWERLMEQAGGAAAFTKLHTGAVMRLYDEHASRKISDGEIIFKINRELYVYRTANVQHALRPLANGAKVLCYFDREDMSWVHLTDGTGGYLGSIPRTRGARRSDKAALQEQFDSQRKALHDLQAKVSARMPQIAATHLAELENNAAILADTASSEAVDIAPQSAAGVSPAPEVALQIGERMQTEKSRIKNAIARTRALKNFRGEVQDLVGELGKGETSNIQPSTSNIQFSDDDRECAVFESGRENRAGESREREQGTSEETSPRNPPGSAAVPAASFCADEPQPESEKSNPAVAGPNIEVAASKFAPLAEPTLVGRVTPCAPRGESNLRTSKFTRGAKVHPLLPKGGEGRGEEANTDDESASGVNLCEGKTPHFSPLPAPVGRGSEACADEVGRDTPCAPNTDQHARFSKFKTLDHVLPLLGDLGCLGSNERNSPEAKACSGPNERERESHWAGVREDNDLITSETALSAEELL